MSKFHTNMKKGKRVMFFMKDGNHFISKFVSGDCKKKKFTVEGNKKIPFSKVRTVSYYKGDINDY